MSAFAVAARAALEHELTGPASAPVVLALGGISATRHVVSTVEDPAPGWWEGIGGDGRALDTTSRRVLGVEFLDGGCNEDGTPARVVTTHDQAAAIVELLDALEIDQLDAAIGASYGGMVALALAERWPERVRRLVVISAAHEAYPMSTALRALQRATVELGLRSGNAREAMIIARGLAMTTYRSAREFAERFPPAPLAGARASLQAELDVERYLRHAGERFAERMRPARFLALSLSGDLHRVRPEQVRVPTTLVAAQGDTLVPPSQMRELARRLPRLRAFHTLRSRRGHDAFLTETGRLNRLLTTILDD
ncbi:MAG TPA: homoserine O-succinyltransferase [Gemmatimonadaceae bacterium]|nr:homoserine O-succinyltransferase [Gemmatimonadaceae bacterium]